MIFSYHATSATIFCWGESSGPKSQESDLYFVPENLKRFLFSRGYELDEEPRWVGLLHNHRVHAEGYLLEPLQGGCFNRAGLARYARFLLGRVGEEGVKSPEELAMKHAHATLEAHRAAEAGGVHDAAGAPGIRILVARQEQ